MADYAQEFERRARDAGYEGDDAKVLLAASLNQTTLVRLDTYVTASFPGTRAGTETIMERLARIPYSAMLAFLKQSSLVDLANQGAGSTRLPNATSVTHENPTKPQPKPALKGSGSKPEGAMSAVGGFEGIFAASTEDTPTPAEEKKGGKQKRKT
jgi:hypothetical protein